MCADRKGRVLGLHVLHVTGLHLTDGGGAVAAAESAAFRARTADSDAQIAAIRKDIIVALAAPYAQQKHRPVKPTHLVGCEDDFENARNFAARAALTAA